MKAGIRGFLSCCVCALVAAPAYAGVAPLPVTVNSVGAQKPKPEVEPGPTAPSVASASGGAR